MAAEGDNNIVRAIFTGEELPELWLDEWDNEWENIIPNATHVSAHESLTVIPARLFFEHPNIVELICHAGVKRIDKGALRGCPSLKRLIIPGVEIVAYGAFHNCAAVTCVECPMLEIIGGDAFSNCQSLMSINLPSAKVTGGWAFARSGVKDVTFGRYLKSIGEWAFERCPNLEQINIPLKNGLITHDNTFQGCSNLKRVDLVEGEILRETIAALLLDEWRNDMNEEIDSINQSLPHADAGFHKDDYGDLGDKALVIREWIARVLHKIIHYKAEHRHLLNMAAAALYHALPQDIVTNNVLSFLELPSYAFDGEDVIDERAE